MRFFIFTSGLLFLVANMMHAHQDGAKFSGAIIEPLKVHHAHIENEQRINVDYLNGYAGDKSRTAFASSLELAFNWNDTFTWGSEILIPYSNTGITNDLYKSKQISFPNIHLIFAIIMYFSLTFWIVCLRWQSQFKLLSILNPKYLNIETTSTLSFLQYIIGFAWFSMPSWCFVPITCIFVFLEFRDSLL